MLLTHPRQDHPGPEILKAAILNSAYLTGVKTSPFTPVGRGWRFRILPNACDRTKGGRLRTPAKFHRLSIARFTRRNHTCRRRHINAVCWHGHRDFMLKLFSTLPTATLHTSMAHYRGLKGFHLLHEETYERNVGSDAYPVYYADLCHCEEEGE